MWYFFREQIQVTQPANDAKVWGYGLNDGPNTWGKSWPIAIEGKLQSPIGLSWAAPEDPTLNQPRLMVNA